MQVRFTLWTAAVVTTLLSVLIAAAGRLDTTPLGLAASYESAGGPSRTFSTIDPRPSTDHILAAWSGSPPDAFAVTWRGVLFVPSDGPYTFATRSDDESAVYLDGRAILENGGGQPGLPAVRATVRPDRGSHAIAVRYLHNGGPVRFELSWAHGDDPLAPIPSWALRTRRIAAIRIVLSSWLPVALAGAEWLAVVTVLTAVAATLGMLVGLGWRYLRRDGAPDVLWWIVGASAALNVVGLGWGLPGGEWAPIEVSPVYVIGAVAQRFSHGWSDAYPPVHFYVLSAAISPVLVLDWLGRIDIHQMFWATVMTVAERLVSVAMAAGTVIAVYACGQLAFSRRAGLFAAAIFALAAPFLYYAKTANVDVPYVFWFAVSLVFYLRLLLFGGLGDYAGLAAAAAFAVCTKDQAYGLYLLPPAVVLWEKGLTRRVALAAAISLTVFVLLNNLPLNFSGFVDRMRFLTGGGSQAFRIVEPDVAGRLSLLRISMRLTEVSWGWPLFLICAAGVIVGIARRTSRRITIWLMAPIVGYYVGFINVILYAYDRFMLPVCLVLAIFGGLALDRFMAAGGGRWRAATVAAALLYTLLYSGTVDVLMVRDSRYGAERWLAARGITSGDLLSANVMSTYAPRLFAYRVGAVQTIEDLREARPRFFIVNVDYARSEVPDWPRGLLIAGLTNHTLGYTLAYRGRTPSPWPWLPGAHPDLVGPRLDVPVLSTLRNINPTIEIFERDATIGR